MTEGISLEQIKTGRNYDLISLYEEYDSDDAERNTPFQYSIAPSCDYLEPDVFRTSYELSNTSMSYFHLNCRGLSSNLVERLRDIKHQNCSNCHKSMKFCVLIVFYC